MVLYFFRYFAPLNSVFRNGGVQITGIQKNGCKVLLEIITSTVSYGENVDHYIPQESSLSRLFISSR